LISLIHPTSSDIATVESKPAGHQGAHKLQPFDANGWLLTLTSAQAFNAEVDSEMLNHECEEEGSNL